jgi:hypothetical protein
MRRSWAEVVLTLKLMLGTTNTNWIIVVWQASIEIIFEKLLTFTITVERLRKNPQLVQSRRRFYQPVIILLLLFQKTLLLDRSSFPITSL